LDRNKAVGLDPGSGQMLISLANKFANGNELLPTEFSGGLETNNFLKKLGFEIVLR